MGLQGKASITQSGCPFEKVTCVCPLHCPTLSTVPETTAIPGIINTSPVLQLVGFFVLIGVLVCLSKMTISCCCSKETTWNLEVAANIPRVVIVDGRNALSNRNHELAEDPNLASATTVPDAVSTEPLLYDIVDLPRNESPPPPYQP
eukprot:GHVT01067576.1.p1 GENE.GHVT01067576.1~~GHVT01067576.1.p1  ORF type:complete len:147 (+),score=7.17 GHVT01067576.1:2530-2970(+)